MGGTFTQNVRNDRGDGHGDGRDAYMSNGISSAEIYGIFDN
jgi:hypothetical protein